MDILLQILLILIAAKGMGECMEQIGYPSMIGEIIAGILLGPALLNWVELNSTLEVFADIGIILLLFVSGAQLPLESFIKEREVSFFSAVAGVIVPFLIGLGIGSLFSLSLFETIFISITLSITSIGISVRSLVDLRQLNSDVGTTIVSAAVFDDIIGIVMLAILSSIAAQAETSELSLIFGIAIGILFLLFFITIGRRMIVALFRWARKTETHEMLYSLAIILALLSAYLAYAAGLHYSIGAFIAGMILGDQIRTDRVLFDSLVDVGFGFFVSIFFASIGLLFSVTWEASFAPIFILILAAAVAGKILGGFIGSAHFLGKQKGWIVGFGLCPRGEIALVVAKIALISGIIGVGLFSAVTLMVLTTIIITPLLLKWGFSHLKGEPATVLPSEQGKQ
jgi:Kef-type K+ transport system membrane component KefB